MGHAGRDHKDDAETSRAADRWIGARLPAVAVFVAAALLVVAIAGIGRIEVQQPDWQIDERTQEPLPAPTAENTLERPEWLEEASDDGSAPDISIPWQAALAVLLVLIVIGIVILLRRLPRGLLSRRRSTVVGGHLDEMPDPVAELRRAVEDASTALQAHHASGSDAVIEAWLSLEAAAEASGAPRQRSQTPSEFTTALLRRYHADAAATTLLRDLYHRARFATDPHVSADDVQRARNALATILRTLAHTVDAP